MQCTLPIHYNGGPVNDVRAILSVDFENIINPKEHCMGKLKNNCALNFVECFTEHMVIEGCLHVASVVWNLLHWLWIERSKIFGPCRIVFFSQSLFLFQM